MSDPTPESINDTQLVQRLRDDPEFFSRHPYLLQELNLTHESGAAISLIERQVAVLRERNMTMRRRLNELMAAGEANDTLFRNIRSLSLALLDVDSWLGLNETLATHLLVDFDADWVCCHLYGDRAEEAPRLDHVRWHDGPLPHENLVPGNKPVCVLMRGHELEQLFPGRPVTPSGSAVLIPLKMRAVACLSVGSRDPERFRSDLDTLFVEYISDVTSHVVTRLLK